MPDSNESNPNQVEMAISTPEQSRQMMAAESIYANGFMVGSTVSDIAIGLQNNGSVSHVLYLSFTGAKTLAQNLAVVVEELERRLGTEFLTIEDIKARMDGQSS